MVRDRAHPEGLAGGGAYGFKSDSTKFGKSEEGAIWLSPYKFYQYFFNVPNADVIRFLKVLTFLDMEEIKQLESDMERPGYLPNTAQRRLAEEVALFVHGDDGLQEALRATEALRPCAETKLDWKAVEGIAEDLPSYSLTYEELLNASVVDLCVVSGLLESKSNACRLLKEGGLYLNNCRVDSESRIEADDVVDGKVLLLSAGKKNKVVVRISLPAAASEKLSVYLMYQHFYSQTRIVENFTLPIFLDFGNQKYLSFILQFGTTEAL